MVRCGDRAGFMVKALLFQCLNNAAAILGDGTELDLAIRKGCGFPLGPLALLDLIGLDVAQPILRNLRSAFHDRCSLSPPNSIVWSLPATWDAMPGEASTPTSSTGRLTDRSDLPGSEWI